MRAILVTTLLAAAAVAEINSGGGTTTSSSSKNTASIGSPFSPSRTSSTATTNRNGFIQFVYAAKLNPDQDRNSLPDEWEVANFGSAGQSASADPDGDGANNELEYLTGTDPNDSKSKFELNQRHDGFLFHLSLQTIPKRTYKVYYSRDLETWDLDIAHKGNGDVWNYEFNERRFYTGPIADEDIPNSYFYFRVEVTAP
ncbi:thrombospondin type 3 repeat-containing protein [Akkermansiaceae bacterium]|nr:thrombospondin type 3 repeat-containing protein [Akkermansiaceae bacterium]MDB4735318.1 thrombospondin type 3 repeat-containing protein [Akkermansiaceae bacterium]